MGTMAQSSESFTFTVGKLGMLMLDLVSVSDYN